MQLLRLSRGLGRCCEAPGVRRRTRCSLGSFQHGGAGMQVNAFGANPYRHLLRLGDRSVSREPNCGCLIFSATKISIRTAEAEFGRGRGAIQVGVRHERF